MSRQFICNSALILGLLSGPASAQSTSFNAPVAGFVYDRASQTVRPMLGVPGATYIGSPVLNDVDVASVAPGGKWALIGKSGSDTFVQRSVHLVACGIFRRWCDRRG